jgi:excisionase family DNA binding protein
MHETSQNDAAGPFDDPRSRLLTSSETGAYLRKSARTVQRLAKRRVIPFIIVGGSLRFRLTDVEQALERYQVNEVAL